MNKSDKKTISEPLVALIISSLAAFVTPFLGSSVVIALPAVGREFHLNTITLSWITMSYLLSLAALLLPLGRVGDICGRKKVFSIGLLILFLSSLAITIGHSAALIIIMRIIQGIGGAFIFSTGTAILLSVTPLADRGKALGITVACTYIGLSMGPFLGGFLTEHFGWRSLFFAVAPFLLLNLILVFLFLKGEWADADGEKFDVQGSWTFAVSIILFMYGFSHLPGLHGIITLIMGIAGLILFTHMENRTESPIMKTNLLFSNRVFAFSNLAALINYSATFATGFLLSLYLQYIKGMSPLEAGMILFWQPAMMALFSPLAGRLSDRVQPGIIASAGMALSATGLLLLTQIGEYTNINYIIASLMLLGYGFALFSSPNTNAVMSSVEKKDFGVASAILGTMRSVGQVMSMGIATLILSVYLGKSTVTPGNHHIFISGLKISIVVFAATCIAGVAASKVRGNVQRKA
ncbi:MAG: MFS transporter [Firmicutes bacterium]|nr:MFS transporter [Bacillota bacterium]